MSTSLAADYIIQIILPILLIFLPLFFFLKRNASSGSLPPGPAGVPFFGNSLHLGHSFNQLLLRDLGKAHRSDIIHLSVGQNHVVAVSSPELTKEVLQTRASEFAFRTRSIVAATFTGNGRDVVFGDDSEHWRALRRVLANPFTHRALHRYWPVLEDEIQAAAMDLAEHSKKMETEGGIPVYPRLQLMMYSAVYYMLFGRRFKSERDGLFVKLRDLNEERKALVISLDRKFGDFVPAYLKPFVWRDLSRCKDVQRRSLTLYKQLVNEHREMVRVYGDEGKREKFVIDHILEAEKHGEISEKEVLFMMLNINIAAIDTTLVPLDWVVAELANNQHIQQKLREEMHLVLGMGMPVSEADLPRLPYLRAVVKETLRLHMPVPLLLPHKNACPTQLGGYHIPGNTKILVNAWWLANNPQHWDEPKEFRPDRFMQDDQKMEITGNDMRFVPFGSGRRSCPGNIFAYNMMCVVVGKLVREWEVHPCNDNSGMEKLDLTPFCTELFHGLAKQPCIILKPLIPNPKDMIT